jgi:nitroreductase
MELTDAVRRRRMIRTYDTDRPVPRTVIDELLSMAVCAPSAGYTQGWRFLVLDDITSCEAFWAATDDGDPADSWLKRLRTARALIICFSDKQAYLDRYAEPDKGWTDRDEAHWPVPYWDIDTGMAAMLILLGAVEHGLGACFFGIPAECWPNLRAAFAVPDRLTPIGVISLGYPAPDVRSPSLKRGRRPHDDVVSYGSFGAES